MPVYKYSAADLDGSQITGSLISDSPRAARDQLREKGLRILELIEAKEKSQTSGFFTKRVSQTEVVNFIRELATLLSAGIPLLDALNTLERQHKKNFKLVLQNLSDQISAGESLAEAMSHHPLWFDSLSVSIVKVGESTGSLERSLIKLAEFKEKASRLKNRVISAMLYPMIVGTIGLAVCIFLMTFVVPSLLETLENSKKELPGVTKFVKAISDILIQHWLAILACIAGSIFALLAAIKSTKGKQIFHAALLKLPVVGTLISKENISRMSVILSSLLKSGLEFIQAIKITRSTLKNVVFQQALRNYEDAISAGKEVAEPLEAAGIFPPMVVQMLAVGQQTGEMEKMLDQLAESYDYQVETATKRLTVILEPVMIILLAVMVGFVAFATILPIMEAGNVL